jgi:hypothetical protein
MILTAEDKKKHRKLIDIPNWVKKELSIEAVKLNYDGLKAYLESILKEKAKELKNKQ